MSRALNELSTSGCRRRLRGESIHSFGSSSSAGLNLGSGGRHCLQREPTHEGKADAREYLAEEVAGSVSSRPQLRLPLPAICLLVLSSSSSSSSSSFAAGAHSAASGAEAAAAAPRLDSTRESWLLPPLVTWPAEGCRTGRSARKEAIGSRLQWRAQQPLPFVGCSGGGGGYAGGRISLRSAREMCMIFAAKEAEGSFCRIFC